MTATKLMLEVKPWSNRSPNMQHEGSEDRMTANQKALSKLPADPIILIYVFSQFCSLTSKAARSSCKPNLLSVMNSLLDTLEQNMEGPGWLSRGNCLTIIYRVFRKLDLINERLMQKIKKLHPDGRDIEKIDREFKPKATYRLSRNVSGRCLPLICNVSDLWFVVVCLVFVFFIRTDSIWRTSTNTSRSTRLVTPQAFQSVSGFIWFRSQTCPHHLE